MENEILIAENVEIDMETLRKSLSMHVNPLTRSTARVDIIMAIVEALSPEDRKRLEEYREQ